MRARRRRTTHTRCRVPSAPRRRASDRCPSPPPPPPMRGVGRPPASMATMAARRAAAVRHPPWQGSTAERGRADTRKRVQRLTARHRATTLGVARRDEQHEGSATRQPARLPQRLRLHHRIERQPDKELGSAALRLAQLESEAHDRRSLRHRRLDPRLDPALVVDAKVPTNGAPRARGDAGGAAGGGVRGGGDGGGGDGDGDGAAAEPAAARRRRRRVLRGAGGRRWRVVRRWRRRWRRRGRRRRRRRRHRWRRWHRRRWARLARKGLPEWGGASIAITRQRGPSTRRRT